MRKILASLAVTALLTTSAAAQFVGPSAVGQATSAEQANILRPGTYVTLTGHVVQHLRSDYFLFRDATGEIRVEIRRELFRDRRVEPQTTVRLFGEVDRSAAGPYVYVETLDIVK